MPIHPSQVRFGAGNYGGGSFGDNFRESGNNGQGTLQLHGWWQGSPAGSTPSGMTRPRTS